MKRKSRIVCTIGPSTSGVEKSVALIKAGMDVARLNFSHGTHGEHGRTIRDIRTASEITGKHVAILQDLQGPKIRTGLVRDGAVRLEDGQSLVITVEDLETGDASRVGTAYHDLVKDVQPGNTVLLDDGYIILTIDSVDAGNINTTVVKGGILRDHQGIIVPDASISAPAVSEKDLEDAEFGITHGVDAVALSFVASEQDVIELRKNMRRFGKVLPIVAKIERYEGISDIEDIIRESDAIMIARGDMGLEMQAEEVPVLQKQIIRRCNFFGKPVITATQMLESMIQNPRPTRAEASDVANAVIDGSDCVMLSGETSIGKYPLEAVRYMDRIIRKAEEHYPSRFQQFDVPEDNEENVADAISRAACVIAEQIRAAAIVPLTSSGGTARSIAKYRPAIPILALTDNAETARMLSFVWGVTAELIPRLDESDSSFSTLYATILKSKFAGSGDSVVYSAGSPLGARVSTNMLRVQTL